MGKAGDGKWEAKRGGLEARSERRIRNVGVGQRWGGGGGQELGYSLQDLRPREGKDGNTRTGS